MVACLGSGTDILSAMIDFPWEIKCPAVVKIDLKGKIRIGSSARGKPACAHVQFNIRQFADILPKLEGLLKATVVAGTVLEYSGPGVESLSCADMTAICCVGDQIGALASIFPFGNRQFDYLNATGRYEIANYAQRFAYNLVADQNAEYDQALDVVGQIMFYSHSRI